MLGGDQVACVLLGNHIGGSAVLASQTETKRITWLEVVALRVNLGVDYCKLVPNGYNSVKAIAS